jgi:EAL domain-containing protein (putative c-di-GMP-specific phosphodiesterase class I)
VSEVKLDRSFTAGSTGGTAGGGAGGGADGPRRSVAQALVAMADALDLTIVAEGVETPEQAVQLFTMGYRRAQGYHFDRPMPAHALTEKLADGRLPSPPAPTRPDLPMVGATAQE